MSEFIKPYQRTVVFSGGGTRFIMYCGMYAAMVDRGIKPDVIIATCGASLSTAIIQAFPNPEDIKTYLASAEFVTAYMATKLGGQNYLDKLPLYCMKASMNSKGAPVLLDLFGRYLIEMPQDLSESLPSLVQKGDNAVSSIVIGSQILYTKSEVGQKRNNRKLYKQVWMPCEAVDLTALEECATKQAFFDAKSAVANEVTILPRLSALQCARISTSDMFYINPAYHNGQYYLGGAVNLIPIELALGLSDEVWIEQKHPYKWLEQALVSAVFGYDANKRLEQVNANKVRYFDTTNAREALKGHYVKRSVDWKSLKIDLQKPLSMQQGIEDIKQQFEYGYQVVLQSL